MDAQKNDKIELNENEYSVLSYDSKISETLTLDKGNIFIDPLKELIFWTQHFQNPANNLNNLATSSSFEKKSKIINGKKGATNIVQPIYFDNTLCHVLNNGYLICVDTISNDTKFKVDIKKEGIKKYELVRGGLAYFDNKIVFVDAYGQIKLINADDGDEVWETNIDFPILSPPLIYRGYIYFISSDNRVFSLDFNSGDIEWTFQTIAEVKKNLYTASPVAFENTVIVPFSNGELVSFIYDTGRPLWSENLSKISMVSNFDIKDISASPVISKNIIYSLSSNGKLISNNVLNGKRLWAIDLSGYRTPIISGGQIYVINDEGKLICLSIDKGEIYWITDLNKYKKGQKVQNMNLWLGPYLINNLLYNISYFGELKVVSPLSGELFTSETIGVKGVMVPPLILNNFIYLADEDSNVFKIE